jgi:hypothetical protein
MAKWGDFYVLFLALFNVQNIVSVLVLVSTRVLVFDCK